MLWWPNTARRSWPCPIAGLVIAALVLLLAAIRWRRHRDPDPPAGSGGGRSGPSGPESSRLDRDLAEYDL
jgi:hypothetical protein